MVKMVRLTLKFQEQITQLTQQVKQELRPEQLQTM